MNQVTKNLALSAPLMTYLHAVVVRLKLLSSPIQFLPQESIVGRAAVCRPQAAEFSLLHLCRGSRAGPGCAASLPTGSPGGYLPTRCHLFVLAAKRKVESAVKEKWATWPRAMPPLVSVNCSRGLVAGATILDAQKWTGVNKKPLFYGKPHI